MAFYRKRPVVIEAQRVTVNNLDQIASWCNGSVKGICLPLHEQVIDIQTLEGEMRADVGDWIIKGVKGEFYPCEPEIFDLTYEVIA